MKHPAWQPIGLAWMICSVALSRSRVHGVDSRALSSMWNTSDLLEPIYQWNSALGPDHRYRRSVWSAVVPIVRETAGLVLVQAVDSPKATGADALVVGANQTSASSVLLEFELDSGPADAPTRHEFRLHMLFRSTNGSARGMLNGSGAAANSSSSDDGLDGLLSAFVDDRGGAQPVLGVGLWPNSSTDPVGRALEAELIDAGEWLQIQADFQLPVWPPAASTGGQPSLFLRLGVGPGWRTASLTDLRLLQLPLANVAHMKPCYGSLSMPRSGAQEGVSQAVLTNNVTAGRQEEWYRFEFAVPPPPIVLELDLQGQYRVCNAQLHLSTLGQVYEWSLHLSPDSVGDDSYVQAISVFEPAFASWRSPEAVTALSSPVSPGTRWFDCMNARRVQLRLRNSRNRIFALTEIRLGGFGVSLNACGHRCRHGGTCLAAGQEGCSCVPKWGWRGADCSSDVDECTLLPQAAHDASAFAVVLGGRAYMTAALAQQIGVEGHNGGCGAVGGSAAAAAECINAPGSWSCECIPGFVGNSSSGAGNECSDVDECLSANNGGCQQHCHNTDGGHFCSCVPGYNLSAAARGDGPAGGGDAAAERLRTDCVWAVPADSQGDTLTISSTAWFAWNQTLHRNAGWTTASFEAQFKAALSAAMNAQIPPGLLPFLPANLVVDQLEDFVHTEGPAQQHGRVHSNTDGSGSGSASGSASAWPSLGPGDGGGREVTLAFRIIVRSDAVQYAVNQFAWLREHGVMVGGSRGGRILVTLGEPTVLELLARPDEVVPVLSGPIANGSGLRPDETAILRTLSPHPY